MSSALSLQSPLTGKLDLHSRPVMQADGKKRWSF